MPALTGLLKAFPHRDCSMELMAPDGVTGTFGGPYLRGLESTASFMFDGWERMDYLDDVKLFNFIILLLRQLFFVDLWTCLSLG